MQFRGGLFFPLHILWGPPKTFAWCAATGRSFTLAHIRVRVSCIFMSLMHIHEPTCGCYVASGRSGWLLRPPPPDHTTIPSAGGESSATPPHTHTLLRPDTPPPELPPATHTCPSTIILIFGLYKNKLLSKRNIQRHGFALLTW